MLVAPEPLHDNAAPTPQPTVVIGRISVVVNSPRPVTAPAPAQPAQRRRPSIPAARAAGPRFAHRFGIGQL